MDAIIAAAKPYAGERRVKDLVVGISLVAVELDNGNVGISYVLRESLPEGCSAFPYVREVIGKPAAELLCWAVCGRDDLQRTIGNAVLNALSLEQGLQDCPQESGPFGLQITEGMKVGMIGMIRPAVMMLEPYHCEFVIFDRAREGNPAIYPTERQAELLPQCDIVFLSGTTTINGTVDQLLDWCSENAQIVMIGASTPMFPQAFAGTKVRILAGSQCIPEKKKELFQLISMASGIDGIRRLLKKRNVRVVQGVEKEG